MSKSNGYFLSQVDKRPKHIHISVAEKALGHALPSGSRVHHVDLTRDNNANSNLVICPSQEYHKLLHARTEALDACGNANWVKCCICKEWDDPLYIRIYAKNGTGGSKKVHPKCQRDRNKQLAGG